MPVALLSCAASIPPTKSGDEDRMVQREFPATLAAHAARRKTPTSVIASKRCSLRRIRASARTQQQLIGGTRQPYNHNGHAVFQQTEHRVAERLRTDNDGCPGRPRCMRLMRPHHREVPRSAATQDEPVRRRHYGLLSAHECQWPKQAGPIFLNVFLHFATAA
jgi:hypothetical protein